jgi:hypothetical protein
MTPATTAWTWQEVDSHVPRAGRPVGAVLISLSPHLTSGSGAIGARSGGAAPLGDIRQPDEKREDAGAKRWLRVICSCSVLASLRWPFRLRSDSPVIEVAPGLVTACAYAKRDRACSELAVQRTCAAVAIADIQAGGGRDGRDRFHSRARSSRAAAMPRSGSSGPSQPGDRVRRDPSSDVAACQPAEAGRLHRQRAPSGPSL